MRFPKTIKYRRFEATIYGKTEKYSYDRLAYYADRKTGLMAAFLPSGRLAAWLQMRPGRNNQMDRQTTGLMAKRKSRLWDGKQVFIINYQCFIQRL